MSKNNIEIQLDEKNMANTIWQNICMEPHQKTNK